MATRALKAGLLEPPMTWYLPQGFAQSGLFSAVTSAFIIGVQSELKPDYEEMNNRLLEMLLNATTGTIPASSATSVPRWSGPDPVIVQVQCILYATLSTTLLVSFLAMLGKQWLNRYRQNEIHESTVDRSRVCERKLSGIETRGFRVVMESLPLILQCALLLLGFALSRYLWDVNRSVSSVVIGFTSFGFLFYLLIVVGTIFVADCPFQTPFTLLIRFLIALAVQYWQNLRQTFGRKRRSPQPRTLGVRLDPQFAKNTVDKDYELEDRITTLTCVAPAVVRFPWSASPLFAQGTGAESDRFDARCINHILVTSTGADVITPVMGFIPEVIWHNGIKDVPLKRIYGILTECFDFSGLHPVVIPGLRDVAYLSAKAFAHVELQRRCITQYEEHKKKSWKDLCAKHPLLSSADHGPGSDLESALFMVDMTLGKNNGFPWEKAQMTAPHHAWMSHVFVYHAWHEGRVSKVVADFVEHSMCLRPPSDIVITDCLFLIGLMIGVPLHVSDIIVKDKRLDLVFFCPVPSTKSSHSREKMAILGKVFQAFSAIFSSKSIQTPSALRALRLVTRLAVKDVSNASYELFKMIMASNDLTDQHWEAARLAAHGAFERNVELSPPLVGEPKEIFKFLDHHLGLQGAGEDHTSSITSTLEPFITKSSCGRWPDPLIIECIRKFDCASPSFVSGMRSIMRPNNTFDLRRRATGLMALISSQWFDSPAPVMGSEEISEFCEHLAVYVIDDALHGDVVQKSSVTILFGMLRSPDWRKHIVTRFWSVFAYCTKVDEELESVKWCLQNALELLEFTRSLQNGEGLKWWYGTLWFHYDKLDAPVRDEVERIARDMSLGDGLPDLSLYLNLIGQEVTRTQQAVDELPHENRPAGFGMELRARLVALKGNYNRLARITGGRQ